MLFDKLVGFVERDEPRFRDFVDDAKIFTLSEHTDDNNYIQEYEELVHGDKNDFFLPFKTTCVEFPSFSIVLKDSTKEQVGFNNERHLLAIIDSSVDNDETSAVSFDGRPIYSIYFGGIVWREEMDVPEIGVGYLYFFDGKKVIQKFSMQELIDRGAENEFYHLAQRIVLDGVSVLSHVNTPDHFVVEKLPVNSKTGKAKIPRSHQRPTYSLLTLKQIQYQLGLAKETSVIDGTGKKKAAHYRRRHKRTFKSDVFKNVKGQTKIIPETWCGPTEAKVGNKLYRVRIDL